MKKRVLVAMSGGVDSSTTAALLKADGCEVVGITMKLLDAPTGKASMLSCCGFGPAEDAKKVAETLGFRHLVADAAPIFRKEVIDAFLKEYGLGRTPNPCILCNTHLKFDYLLKKAEEMGMEALATGHYARIENNRLFKAADPLKDQSYFLYTLNPRNLPRVLFPLGGMRKEETRALARQFSLPVHDKKESQDICFVERGRYREFIESEGRGGAPGFILGPDNAVLGEHEGLHAYTIGQRKGIGPLGKRMYVTAMDAASNSIRVGGKEELLSGGLKAVGVTCCCGPIEEGAAYEVRVRYRAPAHPCRVSRLAGQTMEIRFDRPLEAVSPGQAAVLYRGDEVMGGGVIDEALPVN